MEVFMDTERSRSNCALAVIVAVLSLVMALDAANGLYFNDISNIYYWLRFDPLDFIYAFFNIIIIAYFIVIFISALKNNRKTLFTTLVIGYAMEICFTLIQFIDSYMSMEMEICSGIKILASVLMIMFLIFFALKSISFKVAVIMCSILQLGCICPLFTEIYERTSWGYGFNISFLMYYIEPIIETAILIMSICMYTGAKFEHLEGEKLPGLKTTNTMLWLFLTLITSGICGIVWLVTTVKNVHTLHNDKRSAAGEVLLMLFVPFYSYYWFYTRGKQMYKDARALGGKMSDNAASYLIFAVFGLFIVNYALIQSEFNNLRLAEQNAEPDSDVGSTFTEHKADIVVSEKSSGRTDTMFCRKCGKSIMDDSAFCQHCGEKVAVISGDGER